MKVFCLHCIRGQPVVRCPYCYCAATAIFACHGFSVAFTDTAKLRLVLGHLLIKNRVGPVKLLCIIMFKIRLESLFGPVKAQKFSRLLSAAVPPHGRRASGLVFVTTATVLGNIGLGAVVSSAAGIGGECKRFTWRSVWTRSWRWKCALFLLKRFPVYIGRGGGDKPQGGYCAVAIADAVWSPLVHMEGQLYVCGFALVMWPWCHCRMEVYLR